MYLLILVSLIWAFSFGLIKTYLTHLNPHTAAFLRMGISVAVFLPFFRLKKTDPALALRLFLLGAVQFGVMYSVYIWSYTYLLSYEVAIFTIVTPLYVVLINDVLTRRFHAMFIVSAVIAVAGAGVIVFAKLNSPGLWAGFLLIQIANGCFAFGQVMYSRLMKQYKEVRQHEVFVLMYLGAAAVTGCAAAFTGGLSDLSLNPAQTAVLLYLGVVASGLCFFLWNYGAVRVNTGTLAALNNLKIPLAVVCSLLVFREEGSVLRIGIGMVLILAAVVLSELGKR